MTYIRLLVPPQGDDTRDTCMATFATGRVLSHGDKNTKYFHSQLRTERVNRSEVCYEPATGDFYYRAVRKCALDSPNQDLTYWNSRTSHLTSAATGSLWTVELPSDGWSTTRSLLVPAVFQKGTAEMQATISLNESLRHTLINPVRIMQQLQYVAASTPEAEIAAFPDLREAQFHLYGDYQLNTASARQRIAAYFETTIHDVVLYLESVKTPSTFWQIEICNVFKDQPISATLWSMRYDAANAKTKTTSGNKTKPDKIKEVERIYRRRAAAGSTIRTQTANKLKGGKYVPATITEPRRLVLPPQAKLLASLPATKRSIIRI